MAQADGTILIDTEIDADGMKAGSKEVEAAVRRMASSVNDLGTKAKTALNKQVDSFAKLNKEYAAQAKKVDELKKKVAEYASQKIPTAEYREIQTQIDQAKQKMDRLIATQEKFIAMGGSANSNQYKKYQYDIDELANTIKYAEGELKDLEATGKAFTFGNQTNQAAADMEKLASAERKLSDMNNRLGTSYSSIKGTINDYKNKMIGTDSVQKKSASSGKMLSKVINQLSNAFKSTGKSAKSAQFGIGKMLGTSLLFSMVFQGISAATNGLKEGFTNLAQYSGTTNNSISMLWSSLERLKNSLATAFAPILDIIAPILSKFIDMISTAASYVSMFFAFLSGKSTYTRAVAVQKDYASSLQDVSTGAKENAESSNKAAKATKETAKATEEATEAAEDYLSPLDDINKYTEQNKDSGDGGDSGLPGGGGGGSTPGIGDVSDGLGGPFFEEVEITDVPILENLKNILSQIFKPFKEAWEAEGQATIDAAKYAFSSLGQFAKSVGESFLEVWTNGTGTETLTLILQIFQNIFELIGNIAQKLDEAWNKNELGTQIIQNTFDLLNIVLGTIERITGATADWAKTLDFTPLLSSINDLLKALQPFAENIGAGLEWFWNNVLLPMAGFTIEEIIPRFFETLANAISIFNGILEPLQPLFQWLWDYVLVPIAEWTGGVFLSIWDGINNALKSFSDWCAENPETIQNIAIIIGSFMAAWVIVNLVSTIGGIVGALVAFITTGGLASGVATVLGAAIGFLTSPITIVVLAIGAIIAIGVLLVKNWDEISAKAKEVWEFVKKKFQEFDDFLKNIFEKDWTESFGFLGEIFNAFFKNVENIWNSIKRIFKGIVDFVAGVFTGDWERAWNGVKDIFGGIFDGLIALAKAPINGIIGIINGAIGGINSMINGLNSIHISTPDWLPFGMGGKSFGFNIPNIPNIPYLASGAVIPPNKEFMAVLGDQAHGNNIEAPEGLIRRIVREETRSGNNKYEVVAKVGRKELFRMMIEEGKVKQQQTGKNPFEFA